MVEDPSIFPGTYYVRVRTQDQSGLSFEKEFSIIAVFGLCVFLCRLETPCVSCL